MKKIMFNDRYGLTEAVLTGRKTMTRRILPDIVLDWNRRGKVHVTSIHMEHGVLMMDLSNILREPYITAAPKKYQPRYEIGEVVAVAQCYKDAILDVGEAEWNRIHPWNCVANLCARKGLHNKMFVKSNLMPNCIRITDIKVERLQDISDEDCLHEGIEDYIIGFGFDGWVNKLGELAHTPDARIAFACLTNRIYGKGTWERNPYVFAYTFELVK